MRRGQSSFELIILIGFLFIIFLGFVIVIQTKIKEQNLIQQEDRYVQLADLVEKEILLASKVRPGYMREFTLPKTLGNEPYNLSLEGGDALVIKGAYSQNEYIRFLSVNLYFNQSRTSVDGNILPEGKHSVIIEKTDWTANTGEYNLLIRQDCVKAGEDFLHCPTTTPGDFT